MESLQWHLLNKFNGVDVNLIKILSKEGNK